MGTLNLVGTEVMGDIVVTVTEGVEDDTVGVIVICRSVKQ